MIKGYSIGLIIFTLINWLLALIGVIGIVGMAPFFITSIVYFVKYSKEKQDEGQKNSYFKKGIFFVLLPFALIVSCLILFAIVSLIRTSLGF